MRFGHNFNASHCDGQGGCANSIMLATQTPSNNLTFCPFSVNEITLWVNGHSSCLSRRPRHRRSNSALLPYAISETGPHVDITLTRTGNTTSSASVTFATNDAAGLTNCNVFNGTASPRCDLREHHRHCYLGGRRRYAKTFSVAIVDDSYARGCAARTVEPMVKVSLHFGVRVIYNGNRRKSLA